MAKCKDCHCKCHCKEVLHTHWYDGDLCACDKCNCKRTYEFACTLRAVTSVDGMTADYYPFGHDFLKDTSTRIINEVKGINRVVYDTTSKPPGTIEWE